MAKKIFFSQLSLWMMNLCLYFVLYLYVWIRIHKAPEYGSNTDPNPQHWHKVKDTDYRTLASSTGLWPFLPPVWISLLRKNAARADSLLFLNPREC